MAASLVHWDAHAVGGAGFEQSNRVCAWMRANTHAPRVYVALVRGAEDYTDADIVAEVREAFDFFDGEILIQRDDGYMAIYDYDPTPYAPY